MPKLSVITINLNNKEGLRKTIESIVNQTFTDYEYIIIDGGSTDGSVEIIKEFADKIIFWISESDNGIYDAMNKGILKAKGEWIGIINSGDWYERGAFEIINGAIITYPNIQIIHGCLRVWKNEQIFKIQGVQSSFLPQGMIEHPTCFVKRDVYQELGVFSLTYKVSSDYEFMVRAYTKNKRFHFIDKILANYTLGGISCTSPLGSIETEKIKQQYGFKPLKGKRNKLSEIAHTIRHLIGLLIPDKIWKQLIILKELLLWLRDFIRNIDQVISPKNIPIIINNFNRLSYLQKLINSLWRRGYRNIYIIDNASTYPPLLEFYRTWQFPIIRLKENMGHRALWESSLINKFKSKFYVYTDPDLELVEDCPDDFMRLFLRSLWKHPKAQLVGFSLLINDLPDCYDHKEEVINWETKFYKNKIGYLYSAAIDTTFALHRPISRGKVSDKISFRTAYPYQARHLPWYEDSSNLPEEEIYYVSHKKRNVGMWSSKIKTD